MSQRQRSTLLRVVFPRHGTVVACCRCGRTDHLHVVRLPEPLGIERPQPAPMPGERRQPVRDTEVTHIHCAWCGVVGPGAVDVRRAVDGWTQVMGAGERVRFLEGVVEELRRRLEAAGVPAVTPGPAGVDRALVRRAVEAWQGATLAEDPTLCEAMRELRSEVDRA